MGRIDSSCVAATVTPSKVGASSSCPGTATSTGKIDEPASRAATPQGRAQRCGRARPAQMHNGLSAGMCDNQQQHAAGVWQLIAGPQSASTTPPPLVMGDGTGGEDHAQAAHAGVRWTKHSWEKGNDCPAGSAYGSFVGAPLRRLPPTPPFPGVRLPAWCRSASATAYPLSEDGLTNELLDFFYYLQLTSHEEAARERLLGYVQACVAKLWGPCKPGSEAEGTAQVMLYGSYALGLSLPSSDIDLALTFPAEEQVDVATIAVEERSGDRALLAPAVSKKRQALHLERLHDLAEQLRNSATFPELEVEVYDQCRVPRIHLRDRTCGGVSCDINSSFASARIARIVARQRLWLQDSPLAAFLVRVTKAAVKQWGLHEVFWGGVASTALYCLVLRFLAQMEQLCRHAQVEENLSPPRYEEAAAAHVATQLSSLACSSPLSSPQLSMPHPANESFAAFTPVPAGTASTARGLNRLSAAAAVPSYVPSWVVNSRKHGLSKSSSLCDMDKNSALCPVSVTACSLSDWSTMSSTCDEDREADDEVDGYTQAGLTRTSGATTTATTPISRTAASTPMPAASEAHEGGTATASSALAPPVSVNSAALREGVFPSADGLTHIARSRYGASPARLLLKLWKFLSADAFANGYQVADAFGDDTVWCDCGEAGDSAALPKQLPLMASLELATIAGMSSADLSAASFRLPELMALFRHSSTSLENMLRYQRYPRRTVPTMLSTIFVDPRLPTNS
ncbi:Nucleotidyltransferase domain containing protein [Leishmania donovani]|uniref:Nucleotidyltransferase_domain_containing_protein_ putative/Pfam:PF01909 n=1 Tax=Leishmania donovani TaxID=5661 RepID=A0A6J8FTE6_LEIDO|nr:Nucleotidyltransferase domain containing protein [Leishmania donovani]VDZ49614.1 Nucleotidyltransferase_domain_containing_protein_putative/Pfam:PF01909 [Leishmania donovani]